MHVTTGSISASPYEIIQTKLLSIPNTTNKLDNSVNIDDESLYFSIPRKHNHSTTAPRHREANTVDSRRDMGYYQEEISAGRGSNVVGYDLHRETTGNRGTVGGVVIDL